MKVSELIGRLQEYDPSFDVHLYIPSGKITSEMDHHDSMVFSISPQIEGGWIPSRVIVLTADNAEMFGIANPDEFFQQREK